MSSVLDLFAGPGGWDVAARELGIEVHGIEWDDAACATRRAAGLATLQADIAALDPADFAPCVGLIGSPPCQGWSLGGNQGGREDVPLVLEAVAGLARGVDRRADLRARCVDDRSMLVVEPLRFALACEPRWIALEQVPPVLSLWQVFAGILRERGYSTWTGILEAERYGVPQTRERAILMAHRDRAVAPPKATHQRYVKGEPAAAAMTLLDGEIRPWISMAEALGWPCDLTVRTGTNSMKHSRDVADMVPFEFGTEAPAATVTSKVDRWTAERPSPTIVGGSARCEGGTLVYPTFRQSSRAKATERAANEPAPTLLFGHHMNNVTWVHDRPATTVQCDPRLAPPGHHDGRPGSGYPAQFGEGAVRVTLEEAAILQSFPPGYPWQGTKTKQFEQVGNAVPPLLARRILEELV